MYDIKWDLDDSVNILAGINGAGKSTILDIVFIIIYHPQHLLTEDLAKKVKSVSIATDDGTVHYESFNGKYNELKNNSEDNGRLKSLRIAVDESLKRSNNDSNWDEIAIAASYSYVEKDGRKLTDSEEKDFYKDIIIDSVCSFDAETIDNEGNIEDSPSITIQLENIFGMYSYYIGSLAQKVEKMLSESNPSKAAFNEIYGQRNLFASIMNDFLKETGKKIILGNQEPRFIINDNKDKVITYKELSSGEKQLLLIMLTALLQEKKECIFFIDEPEISLHNDWQYVLIEKIKELNPNCQLILSTHSPSMIMNGWAPCVKNIEDIRTETK